MAVKQKEHSLGAEDRINNGLLDNHIHIINSEIDEEVIDSAIRWIIYENTFSSEKTLTLYINSIGGSLNDAFALIDVMRNSKHPIRTIGLGSVMSSAFLIFSAGTKSERFIAKNSSILCHQYSEEIGDAKHHDIESFVKEAKYTNDRMIKLLHQCSNLTISDVKRKLLPPSDVWLKAEQLIEYGIADYIL